MRLTKAMKAAGISEVSSFPNFNGSYTCKVPLKELEKISYRENHRKLDPTHAKKLAAEFHVPSFRNPILRYDGQEGLLLSIDGQQSTAALLMLNQQGRIKPKYITCDVFFDIKAQEAGKVFYNLTMRCKRMDPWSSYYSALQAGMPFATAIQKVLNKYGYSTPVDDGIPPKRYRELSCVDPLMQANFKKQLDNLMNVLQVFRMAEGELDRVAKAQRFQLGLLDILIRNPAISVDYLKQQLAQRDADHFLKIASDLANKHNKRVDRSHYREAFETVLKSVLRKVKIAA